MSYCHWCGEPPDHDRRLLLARIVNDPQLPGRIVVACDQCIASDPALRNEAELP